MATVTTRFSLHKPQSTDIFEVLYANLSSDMQKIDDEVMARVDSAVLDNFASFNSTGDVVDSGVSKNDLGDAIENSHVQNTDQYLDYGGTNQVTAANVKDAVLKKHSQNTDQYLDYGGGNQCAVVDVKDAISKKHSQHTDQYLDYGGGNQCAVVDVKDAISKKHSQHTDQYLDYGGANQCTVADVKDAISKKHTQASDDNFNDLTEDSNILNTAYLPYYGSFGYRKVKRIDLIGIRNYETIFDGGVESIVVNTKNDLKFDRAGTIKEWTLIAQPVAGQSVCSITIDLWKCTYAQYDNTNHPVDGDSITAGTPPSISANVKNINSTLTGWTTTINAGDIIRFAVEDCTNCAKVTLVLKVE